jgi:hypothetical protein
MNSVLISLFSPCLMLDNHSCIVHHQIPQALVVSGPRENACRVTDIGSQILGKYLDHLVPMGILIIPNQDDRLIWIFSKSVQVFDRDILFSPSWLLMRYHSVSGFDRFGACSEESPFTSFDFVICNHPEEWLVTNCSNSRNCHDACFRIRLIEWTCNCLLFCSLLPA